MPHFAKQQVRNVTHRWLIASGIALLVIIVGLYWINLLYQLNENRHQLIVADMVADKSLAIERRLNFSLMATRMLATQIRLDQGSTERFSDYAPEILNTVKGIANIQLAPGGIISHIYPLAGNEKAIGHNILQDDRRRTEARKAIATGNMTLAGPFELVQGGVAVIGRQPIFVPGDGGSQFWGFASAMIYLDDLLAAANLASLEQHGYSYQLSHNHLDPDTATVFARSEKALSHQVFTSEIQVPNGNWQLTISSEQAVSSSGYYLSLVLLFSVACISFLLSLHLLRQPELLKHQVAVATQQLSEMAFYDSLTGMANRSLLFEHVKNLLTEQQRQPQKAALLYLDLDNFKSVNDNLGHDAGDELLRQVSGKISTLVRDSDIPARIGGDEFCILLKKIHRPEDAAMVADKILTALSVPIDGITDRYPVSASIGIVLIPEHASELKHIFKKADQAMYQAKNNGKNRYCLYRP